LETCAVIDPSASTTSINPTLKRTASFVSLSLNDLPSPVNDQTIATISGTSVSQSPIFKTLPQRRLPPKHHRQLQLQQQPHKVFNGLEIDQTSSTSPPILTLPNLMEMATRTSPPLNLSSSINNMDTDASSKYLYETQTDSNGVSHHRLYTINDNLLRPFSKNETPPMLRTFLKTDVKMPTVNNINGSPKKPPLQKINQSRPSQPLSTIETVLKERSIAIANENIHQPDAIERVNHILKQLYLPPEKSKRL
jgi:hypothetical protein